MTVPVHAEWLADSLNLKEICPRVIERVNETILPAKITGWNMGWFGGDIEFTGTWSGLYFIFRLNLSEFYFQSNLEGVLEEWVRRNVAGAIDERIALIARETCQEELAKWRKGVNDPLTKAETLLREIEQDIKLAMRPWWKRFSLFAAEKK